MIVAAGIISPIGMNVDRSGVSVGIDDCEVWWKWIRVKKMRYGENILPTRKQYAWVVCFALQGEFKNLGGH